MKTAKFTIDITCDACGQKAKIDATAEGLVIKCSMCQQSENLIRPN